MKKLYFVKKEPKDDEISLTKLKIGFTDLISEVKKFFFCNLSRSQKLYLKSMDYIH